MIREVRNRDWGTFCERLNQFEGGASVSIEWIARDGFRDEIARNAAFEAIQIGKRDACSDRISVRCRNQNEVKHDVVEPIHVNLKETEGGGAFDTVMIEAEEGTTVMRFQPVIRTSWLDGLALQ